MWLTYFPAIRMGKFPPARKISLFSSKLILSSSRSMTTHNPSPCLGQSYLHSFCHDHQQPIQMYSFKRQWTDIFPCALGENLGNFVVKTPGLRPNNIDHKEHQGIHKEHKVDDVAGRHCPSSKTLEPSPKTPKPSPKMLKPSPKTLKPSPETLKPSPKMLKPSPKMLKPSPKMLKPSPKMPKPSHF